MWCPDLMSRVCAKYWNDLVQGLFRWIIETLAKVPVSRRDGQCVSKTLRVPGVRLVSSQNRINTISLWALRFLSGLKEMCCVIDTECSWNNPWCYRSWCLVPVIEPVSCRVQFSPTPTETSTNPIPTQCWEKCAFFSVFSRVIAWTIRH